jgi:hypothetical protein
VSAASWASREVGAAAGFPLWVMSHLSSIPLRAHPSANQPIYRDRGCFLQAAVPPCFGRCWLVS